MRTNTLTLAAATLALLSSTAVMQGCRGDRSEKPPRQFFPDLDDQPKYSAQSESKFFKDFEATGDSKYSWGMTQRLPVEGTIPFGRTYHADIESAAGVGHADRSLFMKENDPFFTGMGIDGTPVAFMPVDVNEQLIDLGRSKYNIYCIQCHGGTGEGDGLVGLRWANPLPKFSAESYQIGGDLGQDGHIFDIIRNGKPAVGTPWKYAMPPYGDKVNEQEAWAIVAYIRVLQAARSGNINDVPQGPVRNNLVSKLLESPNGQPQAAPDEQSITTASNGAAQ